MTSKDQRPQPDKADQTNVRPPAPASGSEAHRLTQSVTSARDLTEPNSEKGTRVKPDELSVSAHPSDTATRKQPVNKGAPVNKTSPRPASLKATELNPERPSKHAAKAERIAAQYPGKKILKERFVLTDMLGAGGMGNVYLAKDLMRIEMEDSDPHIAIKVLNDECRKMPGALQSLQREAKKAQALSHPNIVTVYDFDRDGETAFITMEYIDGVELKQHLRRNKRMPHDKAMYVIERVARGLAYAHQQGFAHSDIKPANIFLGKDDIVKILDFGIAKAFTEATKEKRNAADDLTEGALTPAYASLEMLEGERVLPSDDVYSLCCMAYEMISGHHPFIGDDGRPMPANLAHAIGAKVETIPGLSRRHMKALRKGLAFTRRERFSNAGELIDAVKARKIKRDVSILVAALLFAGVGYAALDYGLQQVVPSVSSLNPQLSNVAEIIIEADDFLAEEDISSANRLYAEAWEEASYLTANDAEEREKAHAIIQDRMNQVSNVLINRVQNENIDEYQLRELYVALDFLLRGELTSNEKKIKKTLDRIQKRIDQLD